MHGILNVLKPPGMTSTSVVNHIKKILDCKKAGHTGTLDPQAAGVLPICIGRGTKVANYILAQKKTYICEATLGKETDTGDVEGNVVSSCDDISFAEQEIKEVLFSFKGDIMQIPPIYSAIRHKGKRLYEWAREGKVIEPKARKVTIYNIELLQFYYPDRLLFKVECSKGTYIRSLCRDIGRKLGCGAYMSFLLRTRTGSFDIDDSFTLDEIRNYYGEGKIDEILSTIDTALVDLEYVVVDEGQFDRLINGNYIHMQHVTYISPSINTKSIDEYIKIYCREKLIGTGFLEKKGNNNYLRIKRLLL